MAKYTWEQFERKIKDWERDFPDAVERGAKKGAAIIVGEAQRVHLSGPKMAKGVGDRSNATLAVDTGDLRSAMHSYTSRSAGRIRAFIVNPMIYAAAHEYGYPEGGIPERSFARSSIDARLEDYTTAIRDEVMASYRKS